MAERTTKPSLLRRDTWMEPFVKNVQVPGVENAYSAADLKEKIVWALFLLVCIVLTGVNVFLVSKEYFQEPIVTKASAVLSDDRGPPNMQLCLPFDGDYLFGHNKGSRCTQKLDPLDILRNVISSINSTEDFAEAFANYNIFVRKALLLWIQSSNEIEFFMKYDRKAVEREKEAVVLYKKQIGHNNTAHESLFKVVLQPTDGILANKEAMNDKIELRLFYVIDRHLRSVGITFEYAWQLYTQELLKLFNPHYSAYFGLHRLEIGVDPNLTIRTTTIDKQPVICLRLLLNAHVQAYNGKGEVRIVVDRSGSNTFPTCNSKESPQPIHPPYVTVRPYAHNLAFGKIAKVAGVHGKRKVVQLGIRTKIESHPSEGCEKDAPDIDLCHLECRYRFIRDRCGCKPPLAHRGTQTFVGALKDSNLEVSPAQYLDKEMRECNARDYYLGKCYYFNTDGAEDEEDLCRSACKPNCVKTEWEFTDEQVFDFGENTTTMLQIEFSYFSYPLFKSERKVTWFNVLSDIGGALGLFLGLSIFSVIHTLMLPIHLFMKNREVKRKQALVLTDISVLRQLHALRKVTKAAELTGTETTNEHQGEGDHNHNKVTKT